jgi:hypothetical protein
VRPRLALRSPRDAGRHRVMATIPLDAATRAALTRPRVHRRHAGREYRRVTLAWFPLLRAAMDQRNPSVALCREIERIRSELPEDLQP